MSDESTPWRIEDRTDCDYGKYKTIVDRNGREVTGSLLCGEGCVAGQARPDMLAIDLELICRCVNLHDELVALLTTSRKYLHDFNSDLEDAETSALIPKIDALLAKAKGEA